MTKNVFLTSIILSTAFSGALARAEGAGERLCQAARLSAKQAYAADLAYTQKANEKKLKEQNYKSRARYQTKALKKFWKKMSPGLKEELANAQRLGLDILHDSSLTAEKKATLFAYNRTQVRERLNGMLGTADYDREAALGRFDRSVHTGFLGLFGSWVSRTARVFTGDAPDMEVSLCAWTTLVHDPCNYLYCPSEIGGTTAASCLDLNTGKIDGTDAKSACKLAGSSCALATMPVEADYVAKYMNDHYPACVTKSQ